MKRVHIPQRLIASGVADAALSRRDCARFDRSRVEASPRRSLS
jgi:hypothetical protein